MAILDNCPGLKAEVLVHREPLREYDDDDEGLPRTITKYIEARSGAKFTVSYTFSESFPSQDGVRAVILVDGERCGGAIYTPERLRGNHVRSGITIRKDNKRYKRYFSFTPLKIVEDVTSTSNVKTFQEQVKSTGCITITFQYITDIREKTYREGETWEPCLSALGDLPEKALKGDARSHQATLSALKERRNRSEGKYLNAKRVGNGPFATFHFKYRSKDALKALRIIPSDTEAVPLEERPEDDLTPEELREVLRRMRREREEGTRNVKEERDTEIRFKRERHDVVADQDDEVTVVETRQKRPRVDPDIIVLD